jgi:hypothetical protein
MTRRLRGLALLSLWALGACVYYNAMWSAERFATQARRAEAAGREGEARGWWLRAAVKAESVAVRHPESRWADDAVVLRAEALVRAGGCSQAGPVLARARTLAATAGLGERVRLAAAECELVAGRHGTAAALLAPLLESADPARRARAALLAGQAAWRQGDGARAAALLARSAHPAAPVARARVLIAAGQGAAGLALLDTLAARRFVEADWTDLLAAVATHVSPAAATTALDVLLQRGRVPPDAAARLLAADGDRRAASGEPRVAAERYAAAAALAPDAATADAARARQLRVLAVEADSAADVDRLAESLARLRGGGDQRAFTAMLQQVRRPTTDAAALRAGELARDSLHAPRLATRLFLDVPRRWPASVFAPKAIVAAIALQPERGDSLRAVLDRLYPASPYTQALRGQPAPGFAAAEDSLARALGFDVAAEPAGATAVVAAPRPGPRTVWLDPPLGGAVARGPRPTPPAVRPTQPSRPAARPGERPDDPAA